MRPLCTSWTQNPILGIARYRSSWRNPLLVGQKKKINYSRRLGMIQHTLSDYVYQHGAIDIATDHDLVEAARSGNEEAFVKLWNHHSKKIFGTVIRIVKNHEDAEDVLQEVCLRSFINIQRFDGRSKIYTWITRIAINTALMTLRRKRARSPMVTFADAEGWHPLDIPDESIDIEESCARNERAALLRKAVSCLSPTLQTVIEMYLSQDVSLIEIAELTGISVARRRLAYFARELHCANRWIASCIAVDFPHRGIREQRFGTDSGRDAICGGPKSVEVFLLLTLIFQTSTTQSSMSAKVSFTN
jgi:RNA polymerase sigma-70 factor, ECF subfamily